MLLNEITAHQVYFMSQRYVEMSNVCMNVPKVVFETIRELDTRGHDVDVTEIVKEACELGVFSSRTEIENEVLRETIDRLRLPRHMFPNYSDYPVDVKYTVKDMKELVLVVKEMSKH